MNKKKICHALEVSRWIGVVLGFQLAFLKGANPHEQLHILTPWIVISLAGLTGIESLFFGKAASEITGYTPSAYQRQSGMSHKKKPRQQGVVGPLKFFMRNPASV
jgi:hypothetical protein